MSSAAHSDCIFCKIATGKVPVNKLAESEHAYVIADIGPQAKKHFLVIPKRHVVSLADAFESDSVGRETVSELYSLALRFAKAEGGLLPEGFRAVINTNEYGGQTVWHLHLHLLGGEPLKGSFA